MPSGVGSDIERSRGYKLLPVPEGANPCFGYLGGSDSNSAGYINAFGTLQTFLKAAEGWVRSQPQGWETLTPSTDGWILTDSKNGEQVSFDMSGLATRIMRHDGALLSIEYGTEKNVSSISDAFGRSLRFTYDQEQLVGATLPDGSQIAYEPAFTPFTDNYTKRRILRGVFPSRVTYPDGTQKTYLWSESELLGDGSYGLNSTNLLTGLVDEIGVRFATFSYAHGKPVRTEHAGSVNSWLVSDFRPSPDLLGGPVALTSPGGSQSTISFSSGGRPYSKSQAAGAGSVTATATAGYDASDNLMHREDFKGNRSCSTFDSRRNLESVRVEGLTPQISCSSVLPLGSILPKGARKIHTQWHPEWALHGDVEEYDSRGKHLGSLDPATGSQTKPPVPGRKIDI